MQRQSLGSPASRLPIHYGGAADDDDDDDDKKRRKGGGGGGVMEIEEEVINKAEKPIRWSSASAAASATTTTTHAAAVGGRSIHLIPILTLLCFLVLYLCSHDPSPYDLAGLGGVERLFNPKDSGGGIAGGGGVSSSTVAAALRSHRSLKEAERLRHNRRLGRKAALF